MNMTIGQRIAEARALAGLNQSQLADKLGISPQSVQQWELGKTTPRGKRMAEIAKVLVVTPEWLQFGISAVKATPPPEDKAEITDSFSITDSINIPYFNVELAAGSGCHIDMEEVNEHINVGSEILDRHAVAADQIVAAKVRGDSMSPRLLDGDTVLINTAEKRPQDGKIYAIAVEEELKVKRLIHCFDGSWIISSDNKSDPAYRDEKISRANFERLRVIGRVFMIAVADL